LGRVHEDRDQSVSERASLSIDQCTAVAKVFRTLILEAAEASFSTNQSYGKNDAKRDVTPAASWQNPRKTHLTHSIAMSESFTLELKQAPPVFPDAYPTSATSATSATSVTALHAEEWKGAMKASLRTSRTCST